MADAKFYAMVQDYEQKAITSTISLITGDKYIEPTKLKQQILANAKSQENNMFDIENFFQISNKDDWLYLQTYKKNTFKADFGIKGDYYIFSNKIFDFIFLQYKTPQYIARPIRILDKNGLVNDSYWAVRWNRQIIFYDSQQSEQFLEKHTQMPVPINAKFIDKAHSYDFFEFLGTYFIDVIIVDETLKNAIETQSFTGYKIIELSTLKTYFEKYSWRIIEPKRKPNLP